MAMANIGTDFDPSDYPFLAKTAELARLQGLDGGELWSEIGGDDLVKAWMSLGRITVTFCAMSTTDDADEYGPEDIGWDCFDAETTGSLFGGSYPQQPDAGVAKTPGLAVAAVCRFLLDHGFAYRENGTGRLVENPSRVNPDNL